MSEPRRDEPPSAHSVQSEPAEPVAYVSPSPDIQLARFEEMKRYVRFSSADERLLRRLCEVAKGSFDDIATEFYERTREHEEAHAVFKDESQIRGLHRSLVGWLERVLTGPYDAAYLDSSARIGHRHHQLGLPHRYMFTGMTLLRMRLQQIAEAKLPDVAPDVCMALMRVLDLELAIMGGTYLDAHEARIVGLEQASRERVLERTERRYVRAIDLSSSLIVGLDRDGRVHLFNTAASKLSGLDPDEARGRHFRRELLACGEGCAFEVAFDRLVDEADGLERGRARCKLQTRTGKLRDMVFDLARVGTRDDDVIVYVQGTDVTEEARLAARLRQSERLAAAGTLAAGLAHEIRNPLNGAQLHLTFLKRALDRGEASAGAEINDAVDVVASEISRLSDLVSDFLEFARPRALRLARVGLRKLVTRSAELVRPDAERRGAGVSAEIPNAELFCMVDEPMIEQLLLNLMQNAVDAVADGRGSAVKVRAYREPHSALIEVIDDGPGLADPDAPIFDAFYSTKPHGTGLGLAIVHRIVADHGGSIAVSSRVGETVFRVSLPLPDPTSPDSQTAPPAAAYTEDETS